MSAAAAGANGFADRLVDRAAAAGAPLALRWACLLLGHGTSAAGAVSAAQRLRAPAECRDLGRLLVLLAPLLARAETLDAAAWLELIERSDALRRPERLQALVQASRWAQGDGREPAAILQRAAALTEAARGAAREAAAQPSAAAPGLATRIRAARLEAIEAALASPGARA